VLRTLLQIGLGGAIFAGASLAQSTLSGHVLALSDGDRKPAAGAWVVATGGSPPRTIASAQADEEGAYQLGGLPEGRVEFTVSHRGYFTYEVGGASMPSLARTCPASGLCGEADFVIAKASVVEGYVTDPFGDPLASASVQLNPRGESAEPERRGPRRGRFGGPFGKRFAGPVSETMQATDDRGYFRFYGVTPGEYQLEVRPEGFFLGEIYTTDPVNVTVELGRASQPLYIALRVAAEPVRVGGTIDGLNLKEGETVRIMAANLNPSFGARPLAGIQVETEDVDAPRLSGQLAPGEYVLTAQIVDDGVGMRAPGRVVTLGRYRIESDMTDLRLTARAGASFLGRVQFEDLERQRVNLSLVPLDGGTPDNIRIGGNGRFQGPAAGGLRIRPESMIFERSALLPGRYRLRADSDDYFITSETEFALSDGQNLETDIVVSGAFGEIRGTVRRAAEDTNAGAMLVALRDEAGKIVSIQSDASGQYRFAKLRPGEYQICAWSDAVVNPQNEQVWSAAGAAVKRFPVAAGDEIEIVLTAKP